MKKKYNFPYITRTTECPFSIAYFWIIRACSAPHSPNKINILGRKKSEELVRPEQSKIDKSHKQPGLSTNFQPCQVPGKQVAVNFHQLYPQYQPQLPKRNGTFLCFPSRANSMKTSLHRLCQALVLYQHR